jgi:hypothetical protein
MKWTVQADLLLPPEVWPIPRFEVDAETLSEVASDFKRRSDFLWKITGERACLRIISINKYEGEPRPTEFRPDKWMHVGNAMTRAFERWLTT